MTAESYTTGDLSLFADFGTIQTTTANCFASHYHQNEANSTVVGNDLEGLQLGSEAAVAKLGILS